MTESSGEITQKRKEAGEVAEKIWDKSMRLSHGGFFTVRKSTDPKYSTITIRGGETLGKESFWEGKGVDLIIERISGLSERETTVETFIFYTTGSGVVKETLKCLSKGQDLPAGTQALESHEANKEELDDLWTTIENSVEMTTTLPSDGPKGFY